MRKMSKPKYQTPPWVAEGENWNAEHSLRTDNKIMRKFTEFITGL